MVHRRVEEVEEVEIEMFGIIGSVFNETDTFGLVFTKISVNTDFGLQLYTVRIVGMVNTVSASPIIA